MLCLFRFNNITLILELICPVNLNSSVVFNDTIANRLAPVKYHIMM